MFLDECSIRVAAGHGGAGCISFRREKFVARGGPDGGDGGHGGSVFARVNPNLRTLNHLRNTPTFRAANGKPGMGKQMFGAGGGTLWIEVPPGTAIVDEESGELLADAVEPGREIVLAQGGRGGKGNVHFKGPTRRVPRIAGKGTPGESRSLRLTLRLLADIGLVGLPNAGKSTLLSRLSNARPKIADYPFTTLEPKLGIVGLRGFRSVLVADLPGLIEGASEGKGLGQRFLRHIERTRFLLILIDALDPRPAATFELLRHELNEWSRELGRRRYQVCYSKIDLLDQAGRAALPDLGDREALRFSAHTGEGIKDLLRVFEEQTAGVELPGRPDALSAGGQPAGPGEPDGAVAGTLGGEPAGAPGSDCPWPREWVIPKRAGALPAPAPEEEEN
jgi:GTPase